MEKTQQALAKARARTRRQTAQRAREDQQDTQHSDAQESASAVETEETAQHTSLPQDSASTVQDTQNEIPPSAPTDTAQDSASTAQDESTAQDSTQDTSTPEDSASAVVSIEAAQAALAHAREAEQRARDAANEARKAAQAAQRDFDRVKREAEEAAQAAKKAQYKIDVVTASPLDANPELRQKILSGGMIAIQAVLSAVESGTLIVRARKKTRVAREASAVQATSTTPRAPGRILSSEEIADIVQRGQAGEKAAEIGKVHGLHHVTISAILSGRISAK